MQTYIIGVRDRALVVESSDTTLVRTSVGVDQCSFRFYGEEWTDETLTLSAAFHVDDTLEEVPLALSIVSDEEWLAEATVGVPDAILQLEGNMGVTVHGVESTTPLHIITAAAYPLTIEEEGVHEN